MAEQRHGTLGLLDGEYARDHSIEDRELQAIKARVLEMEEEAAGGAGRPGATAHLQPPGWAVLHNDTRGENRC
ncbi:hypothetical protein COCON_G00101880 [Conger conger]|uniref:Uncharacterized protein n=1 Tax=Conger conger TaxID=82655 RepID=A0A9Q1DI49_CONCO|nr:hypothetical protein COCON_G00101880 [Conger conger]